jgi:putative zinc finger protein
MSPTDHDQDKLLGFAYGELSPPEAKSLEAHLKNCPQCTRALEDIRKVRRTMAQLPIVPAPVAGLDSLHAYAQQAARRAQAGSGVHSRLWKWVLLPSTGVLAVVLLVVVTTRVAEETNLSRLKSVAAPKVAPPSPSPQAELSAGSDIAPAAKQAESPKEKEAAAKAQSKPSPKMSMKAAPQAAKPSGKTPVAEYQEEFTLSPSKDESDSQVGQSPMVKSAATPQESRGVTPASAPASRRLQRDVLDREIARTQDALRTKTLPSLERARLLNHLCELLYAANRSSEADSTCDQVIRDFPGSAAADAARQLKEKNQRDPAR